MAATYFLAVSIRPSCVHSAVIVRPNRRPKTRQGLKNAPVSQTLTLAGVSALAQMARVSQVCWHVEDAAHPGSVLIIKDSRALHQDPIHWRRLRFPWLGRDRAIRTASGRRRGHTGFPVLWDVLAVIGNQLCADRPAAMVGGEPRRQRPLQVPGVREDRGLAYPWADLAADVFPRRGGCFTRCRPSSVRATECRPPEMMSQSLSIA